MTKSESIKEWRTLIEKDIPKNAYQVSNYGELRSLDHFCKNGKNTKRIVKGQIIKPCLSNSGYKFISITKLNKKFYIHRLVVKYFIGTFKSNLETNHKDGNKINNYIDNLELVTRSENLKHKHRVLGYKVHNQKLNKEQANEIRNIYLHKEVSQKKLAKQFGTSPMVINRIINNIQLAYKI